MDKPYLNLYYIARGFVEPGDVVVDAGCGCGYGTAILSSVASKVIGIDRNEEMIDYAMKNYKESNNYFSVVNLDQLDRYPECDVFVVIKVIEYLRFASSFLYKAGLSARKRVVLYEPNLPKGIELSHLGDQWKYWTMGPLYIFTSENE